MVPGAAARDQEMGLVLRTVTTTPTRALMCVVLVLCLVLGATSASLGHPEDRPSQGFSIAVLAQHHGSADRIDDRSLECQGGTFCNAWLILSTSFLTKVRPATYLSPGDRRFPASLFPRDFFRPPRASKPA